MSLNAAIQIGRSALTASQIGIQVAGNNMANASTPGFTRQVVSFRAIGGDGAPGISIGRGVNIQSVRRQIDEALQARLYLGVADQSASQYRSGVYSAIESSIGELSDHDLSSELSSFFNTFSERANLTKSSSAVVQQGDKLAGTIRRQRGFLEQQREQIDRQIGAAAQSADQLLTTIADLNAQISASETGADQANTLRDQRDQAVSDLASMLDVTVIDHGRDGVDILIGSTPIVYGSNSRGLQMVQSTQNGQTVVKLSTRTPPEELSPSSGQLGAMLTERTAAVDDALEALDRLSAQLIFQINKLHSTGANVTNLSTSTGSLKIQSADRTRAINDPLNQTFADLPFAATNGGLVVRVKDTAGGTAQEVRINVDLDGLTAAGAAGTADDTTPDQIRLALNAVPGISASWTNDGKLKIDADAGFEFSFQDDSSGVLAVLGVNSYFTGTDGQDIAVRSDLVDDPNKLMTGRFVNNQFVENSTALAVSGLQSQRVAALDDRSMPEFWRDRVQAIGVASASASADAQATGTVRESLEAQRSALSGVSMDEESINLMAFQRQYQGAARLITVANDLMDTLMQLV